MNVDHGSLMTAAAPQGRRLLRALRLDVVALVHLILVVAGVCYAALVVDPRVSDPAGAGNGLFLFDSSAYLETARHVNILSLFHLGRAPGASVPAFGTDTFVLIQGRVAWAMLPKSPDLVVFLWNYALLLVGLAAYARVARRLGLTLSRRIRLALFLNPFIWFNLVTLTKEAWGVALIALFVLFCVRRRWIELVVVGALSIFNRQYYPLLAAGMGSVALFRRVKAWWFLVAVAGAYGTWRLLFGDVTGFALTKSSDLGQRSARVMHYLGEIQGYPFGHVLASPVILAFNLSAWVNSHQWTVPATAVYAYAENVSAFLFCVLLALGIFRYWRDPTVRPHIRVLGRLLFTFAVLDTLYPFSQHRYLLPVYPLLVLWALAPVGSRPFPSLLGTRESAGV